MAWSLRCIAKSAVLLIVITIAIGQAADLTTYQGRLLDDSGKPVEGRIAITITLYDDSLAGNIIWIDQFPDVPVSDGLFCVNLSFAEQTVEFNKIENLFMGLSVDGSEELSPRTRIIATPLSLRTATIEGATGGEIHGNVTITDGLTVGPNHTNTGKHSFVAGSDNYATFDYATVSGGNNNSAIEYMATVGGGFGNTANAPYSTVGGGENNVAGGIYATVPGGILNYASGDYSVAMGNRAKALHDGSVIIVANFCPL